MTQEPAPDIEASLDRLSSQEIITSETLKQAFSFIDLGELCLAMSNKVYSAQDEIGALIDQAKDAKNPTQQLAAIKVLHARRMEALKNSGAIVTATESITDPDGVHRTLSTNIVAHALRRNIQSQPVEETHHAVQEKEEENRHQEKVPALAERPETKSETDTGPRPVLNHPPSDAVAQALPGLAAGTESPPDTAEPKGEGGSVQCGQ